MLSGRKGNHTSPSQKPFPSPSQKLFPFPYTEAFDEVEVYQAAPFFYDQMGAWEVSNSSDCFAGRCMMQVATQQYPICWDID